MNSAAITAEYAHIPDEVFRKGRLQVLMSLLEAPGVFRTEPGRQWWRPPARTTCAPNWPPSPSDPAVIWAVKGRSALARSSFDVEHLAHGG